MKNRLYLLLPIRYLMFVGVFTSAVPSVYEMMM